MGIVMYFMAPSMMIHEVKSPYGVEKTTNEIVAKAKEMGWKVPKVYNFQKAVLEGKGPDIGKIKVVKLCHPKFAGELLKDDDNKFVSVMMPCSMAVYEKSDGTTYVASMNMRLMSKVADDDDKILSFLK